jgi:CheY-like chemotaxis protein
MKADQVALLNQPPQVALGTSVTKIHHHDSSQSGLGLNIVRKLITELGGSFLVQCPPSGGSIFSVTLNLPIVRNDTPSPPASTRLHASAGQTILLIEDVIPILKIQKRALKALGYNVLTASNSKEALETVRGGVAIHLIIMDNSYENDKVSGAELASIIRQFEQKEKKRPTPIILTSGNHLALQEAPDQSAITHFLLKPIHPNILRETVAKYLTPQLENSRQHILTPRTKHQNLVEVMTADSTPQQANAGGFLQHAPSSVVTFTGVLAAQRTLLTNDPVLQSHK